MIWLLGHIIEGRLKMEWRKSQFKPTVPPKYEGGKKRGEFDFDDRYELNHICRVCDKRWGLHEGVSGYCPRVKK